MQYTLRNVPKDLDRALRERAKSEHKSINQIAIDALTAAFGLSEQQVSYRDTSDVAGTWQDDPETDAVLAEQRHIDEHLWR